MKRILLIVILCALYDIVALEYQPNTGTDTMFPLFLVPVFTVLILHTLLIDLLYYVSHNTIKRLHHPKANSSSTTIPVHSTSRLYAGDSDCNGDFNDLPETCTIKFNPEFLKCKNIVKAVKKHPIIIKLYCRESHWA